MEADKAWPWRSTARRVSCRWGELKKDPEKLQKRCPPPSEPSSCCRLLSCCPTAGSKVWEAGEREGKLSLPLAPSSYSRAWLRGSPREMLLEHRIKQNTTLPICSPNTAVPHHQAWGCTHTEPERSPEVGEQGCPSSSGSPEASPGTD